MQLPTASEGARTSGTLSHKRPTAATLRVGTIPPFSRRDGYEDVRLGDKKRVAGEIRARRQRARENRASAPRAKSERSRNPIRKPHHPEAPSEGTFLKPHPRSPIRGYLYSRSPIRSPIRGYLIPPEAPEAPSEGTLSEAPSEGTFTGKPHHREAPSREAPSEGTFRKPPEARKPGSAIRARKPHPPWKPHPHGSPIRGYFSSGPEAPSARSPIRGYFSTPETPSETPSGTFPRNFLLPFPRIHA